MGLEQVVNKTISTWKLSDSVAPLCYKFFSPEDAKQAESFTAKVILAYRLRVFLYAMGVVPRILPNGKRKHINRTKDFSLLGYSRFTHHSKKLDEERDLLFKRLMMNIVKQNTRKAGPSVEEIINEIGSHKLIVQRYGRPVSYDDVLPLEFVMRKYITGQRAVTIRIGSRSMQMTPETPDDFWILNPSFIKLRINGARVNERLYYFWQRVGKEQWEGLVNQVLRQRRVVEHLGLETPATYDAIELNPKAKFIKKGALPSRELVRLGISTMPRGKTAKPEPTNQGQADLEQTVAEAAEPPVVGYEE